jgi:pyruvate formate lyase activating enzyme
MGFLAKLDTNGSKPEVLQNLLKNKLVDYIAMDIKAPIHMYDRLSGVRTPITQIKESIILISRSGIAHDFRTTLVKPLLSSSNIQSIRKLVPPDSNYRLQKFCPEHALNPTLREYKKAYSGDQL